MKVLCAEYVPYMKAYRLYEPKNPQQTIAYEENLKTAETRAQEQGYDKLIERDIDTMHIECY